MDERRVLPRWQLKHCCSYQCLEEETTMCTGVLHDINLVGVKVYLKTKAELRTKIRLMINIPNQMDPIVAQAEVLWQSPAAAQGFPTGLRFRIFRPTDKEKVLKYFQEDIKKNWWSQELVEKTQDLCVRQWQEKRSFMRFSIRPVVKFRETNYDYHGYGYARDISATGLALETKEEFETGSILEISLYIPEKEEGIILKSQVIWAKKMHLHFFRLGLKFIDIDAIKLDQVLSLLKEDNAINNGVVVKR